ncbi:MAG: DUF2235 domain-containing protein, partial [Hyphomicrobiaceae bacterium]
GTDPGHGEYRAFISGAVGYGLDQRILEGYQFLSRWYEPGDEIYLYGFSRGAFEARSLAGLVALVGLLGRDAAGEMDAAWLYYREHKSAPDPDKLERLRRLGHGNVRIRCLGVWDTVGNLGIPLIGRRSFATSFGFHDTELSANVQLGLHALAIDEPRGPFSPTLWTRPRGMPPPPGQHIEQVWFPGSHASVGGGFRDSSLSDIALLWMAERSMALTGIAFDIEQLRAATRPDPMGELVSPTSDGIYRVTPLLPFLRLINQNAAGIPGWRRASLGAWRTSLLDERLETVNESIHPAAVARFGQRARYRHGNMLTSLRYNPPTLRAVIEGRTRP